MLQSNQAVNQEFATDAGQESMYNDIANKVGSLFNAAQSASAEDAEEAERARAAFLQNQRMLLARERQILSDTLAELQDDRTEGAEADTQQKKDSVWKCCAELDFNKSECLDLDCVVGDRDSFLCAAASEEGVILARAQHSDLSGFDDPFALLEADAAVVATRVLQVLPDGKALVAFVEQDSIDVQLRKIDDDGNINELRGLKSNDGSPVSALASQSTALAVAGACHGSVKVWHLGRQVRVVDLAHPDLVAHSVRFPDPHLVISLNGGSTESSAHADTAQNRLMFWDLRQADRCVHQLPAAARDGTIYFDAVAGRFGNYVVASISKEGSLEAWDTRHALHRLCKADVAAPRSDMSLTSIALGPDSTIALAYAANDGSDAGSVMLGDMSSLKFQAAMEPVSAACVLCWGPPPQMSRFQKRSDCLIVGQLSGKVSCLRQSSFPDSEC